MNGPAWPGVTESQAAFLHTKYNYDLCAPPYHIALTRLGNL